MKLKPLSVALLMALGTSSHATIDTIKSHQPNSKNIKSATESDFLILATGIFDPLTKELNFDDTLVNNVTSNDYGIIQFHSGKSDPKWLMHQGFKVIQSISNNSFVVNWHGSKKTTLQNNSDIRWYGPFKSGYKVSPKLWPQNRNIGTFVELEVSTFSDYPVSKLNNLLRKFAPKAQVISNKLPKNDSRIVIAVNSSDLDSTINKLASAEAVQWINFHYKERFSNEDAVPALQNSSSSLSDQSIFDKGIYGTGQIVAIADSGLDRNEDWFVHYDNGLGVNTAITDAEDTLPPAVGTLYPDNKVIAYWTMPGAVAYDHSFSYHGTHVSGSVAGDSQAQAGGSVSSPTQSGYDADDGMAPNAQILFQDIGSSNGLSGAGSSPMWEQAYNAGSYIHSNSYGAPTVGEYVSSDHNLDRSLRDLDNMIIIVAAGNDNGTNNSTSSPGNAKNALTVGALGHGNSNTVAGFSNRGLTDDGRLKPDISTTGSSILSAAGDSNNSNTIDSPSKSSKSGTSMATPITAGATALLRQYFIDGFFPSGIKNIDDSYLPSGPLMKAMLLNGSDASSGFNYRHTGWGKPWLNNTLYFDGDTRKIRFWDIAHENGLSTGENISFDVDVLAGEEFRATLTWYDLPGPTGSGITLVNNLNLTVIAPDGTYLGNQFNSVTQAESQTGGSADNINTVEQVRLTAPLSGSYQVTVSASNTPGDGTFGSDKQGFALVVGGDLGSNSPLSIGNPSDLTVTNNDPSGVQLNWMAANNASHYEIYRNDGNCMDQQTGSMRFIGNSTTSDFMDDTSFGGYDYSYQVRAFNSDNISEYSNCIDASSQQFCPLPPEFNSHSVAAENNPATNCSITLNWDTGNSLCPLNSNIAYKIYRSTSHNFIPSNENLISNTSNNQFTDYAVTQGVNYFYRVSAINNDNETPFSEELVSTPLGTPSNVIGTITDNVEDNVLMSLAGNWSLSNDRSSNGLLSYRNTFEEATTYSNNTCSRMLSPILNIPDSSTSSVDYQAWWEIEAQWDGVVVEISTDGGNNWSDLPPVGGYPSDFSLTQNPPINECGYPTTQGAFGGTSSGFTAVSHDLAAFAGQSVQIRWSFSSDPGSEMEGFYMDAINYNNVYTPQVCTFGDLIFEDGFE
jgi:hypothetical protein